MSKILITGVAGLLGNHLSRYLLEAGHVVVGIDNLSGGYADLIHKYVVFCENDLVDTSVLKQIFRFYQPEVVYHFAAYAALGISPFIRNYNYTNNVIASINVINACVNHNVRKLIFSSSMDVYGKGLPPFSETDSLHPLDPYGISKYAVELDIREAHERFGLSYNIIRPHNVIGIYQNIWDRYRNVIGIWIRQILNHEPITIFGDGNIKRAFSDIRYCMEPFAKLINGYDNEVFNIGSDRVTTINEIADIVVNVAHEYGYNVKLNYSESRTEVKEAYCSHDKAKVILDFKDETDLVSTIKDMFDWARTQPNREVKTMPYEINKGIYSYWK